MIIKNLFAVTFGQASYSLAQKSEFVNLEKIKVLKKFERF